MSTAIECQHVTLERRRQDSRPFIVLDDISAAFNTGSMNLISGVTGTGKTSLLHILAGLLRPTAGQIRVQGRPVSRWVEVHRSRWRRRAGIAFQHHNLFSDLTALENVMLPLLPWFKDMRELRRLARQALAALDMEVLAGEKIVSLSGGERQRVNLARALVNRPQYVFVDEPTAHQDNDNAAAIMHRLAETKAKADVVILVAHDPRVETSAGIDAHYRLVDGKLTQIR